LRPARWEFAGRTALSSLTHKGAGLRRALPHLPSLGVVALTLLIPVLLPMQDTLPERAQVAYDHALGLYHHGLLERSQLEAEWGYTAFRSADPAWAAHFKHLEAEIMLWRGMETETLRLLAAYPADPTDRQETVHLLAIQANAYIHRRQLPEANQQLLAAEALCRNAQLLSCGDVLKARGMLDGVGEDFDGARQHFLKAYSFALTHHDLSLQTTTSLNLGWAAMMTGRYDEAMDWWRISYRDAVALGDEDLALNASGNLGLAYYPFGDAEQSRAMLLDAAKTAARLGDLRDEAFFMNKVGEVEAYAHRYASATGTYRQSIDLARKIGNKEAMSAQVADLADLLIETGKLDEAESLLDQSPLVSSQGSNQQPGHTQLSLAGLQDALLRADLASARHQDEKAEALYRRVQAYPHDAILFKSRAGIGLARTYERAGQAREAESTYKAELSRFEAARAQAKGVASQLPLLTIGLPLYNGYVQFLVGHGRPEEALQIANQSRAQTLSSSLQTSIRKSVSASSDPRTVARRTGATLLFYWLAEKHSYLWTITPQKIALFKLPPATAIEEHVLNYRKALLELQDPLVTGNADGRALYAALVAPAAGLLRPNAPVILLDDGSLSKLNFETLPVPGAAPGRSPGAASHYWIEDVTLRSAPSLSVLDAEPADGRTPGKLLLMGDALSPGTDYPELPMAPMEMKLIEKHFSAANQTVLAKTRATPAAYLESVPARFSYIHFVTHGVASSTDPLDSSIILSRSTADNSSFKLYARDILQHPIGARLVTISACYGSGSRAYSGEGLVGLSWAFLGAGAHNVIGALWEVSDESTPRLMDRLYQGIQQGQEPSVALRRAKLSLLRDTSNFHAPFFWAPFQIYSVH